MQAGDYAGALPLLEQAVQQLNGSGRIDEAYADYNLAYTRRTLGRCTACSTCSTARSRSRATGRRSTTLRADARHAVLA